MKKTCNGCKALCGCRSFEMLCALGHPIKGTKEISGVYTEFVPTEECPKPKTLSALAEATMRGTKI